MTERTRPRIDGAPREALREKLRLLGFDEVRFAAVDGRNGDGLRDWLAAGRHGDMAWMERTAEKRAHADLVLPGVRSVILLGVNYWRDGSATSRIQKSRKAKIPAGRAMPSTRIITTP
jgi:epoxyqueuosine reductase QueG